MLPSMRHFLKFIDAYEKWDAHGFNVKVRYEKRKLNVRGHLVADKQSRKEVPSASTGPGQKLIPISFQPVDREATPGMLSGPKQTSCCSSMQQRVASKHLMKQRWHQLNLPGRIPRLSIRNPWAVLYLLLGLARTGRLEPFRWTTSWMRQAEMVSSALSISRTDTITRD